MKSLRADLSAAKNVLIFLGAVFVQLLSYEKHINLYDEGIILSGAHAVLNGKLPYRDFWTMYGPGQFFLGAWLFSLVGETDIAIRAIGVLAKATIVVLIGVLARRLIGAVYGYLSSIVVLGILMEMGQDAFPVFPAVAFSLAAIILADMARNSHASYFVAAGICTGVSTCFRHDLGIYGAAALLLSLVAVHVTEKGRPLSLLLFRLRSYVVGVALVIAPLAIYFCSAIPFADLWENLVTIPSRIYPNVRSLPWPGSLPFNQKAAIAFSVYVPFIAAGVGLLIAITEIRKLRNGVNHRFFATIDESFLWMLTTFTCLFFSMKGIVRVEPLHMVQSLVLATPLVFGALKYVKGRAGGKHILLQVVSIMSALLLLLLAARGVQDVFSGSKKIIKGRDSVVSRCLEPEVQRARCADVDADYVDAIRFIGQHTSPGEVVYVGTGRHDKIFINAVAFYFLANRMPATKWYELHPGVQTQERIQRQMIEEFESRQPKYMVLDQRWDSISEPNDSSKSSGVKLLDEYIQDRYRLVQTYGTLQILQRTSDV